MGVDSVASPNGTQMRHCHGVDEPWQVRQRLPRGTAQARKRHLRRMGTGMAHDTCTEYVVRTGTVSLSSTQHNMHRTHLTRAHICHCSKTTKALRYHDRTKPRPGHTDNCTSTCIDIVQVGHIQGTCTAHARCTHGARRQHAMHRTSTGHASRQHFMHGTYKTALAFAPQTHDIRIMHAWYIHGSCVAHV